MRAIHPPAAIVALLALCGCGGEPQPAPQAQTEAKPASETDTLRAADAVGYDGEALQRNVDRMQRQAAEQAAATDAAARGATE
ncbi:MAG TPA: hypothetical protein VEL07_18365 [Planctomycetota bacterium]|nr:hypothetical protein [Planctomycetota bacterium]